MEEESRLLMGIYLLGCGGGGGGGSNNSFRGHGVLF